MPVPNCSIGADLLRGRKWHQLSVWSVLCLALVSCAPKHFVDPIAVMVDRQEDPGIRRRAAEQAHAELRDDPERIKALNRLVWEWGHPTDLRALAIDQLIELDETEFRRTLSRRIVLINNPETLQYLFQLAIERNWDDFTPVAIRSYARPAPNIPDAERPEKAVILKLNPGISPEKAIFRVFADGNDEMSVAEQVAAWELLNRLCDQQTLFHWLDQAPSNTPLVIDLKASAADFGLLPRHREGVLWLAYWRDPARREIWGAAAQRISRFNPDQRDGLAMRHLPVILALTDAELNMDRSTLAEDVTARTRAAGDHFLEGPTYDGPMRDYPQRLSESMQKLSWADLATLRLLLRAISEERLATALFNQADRDRVDKTTEHGGVLDISDGRFVVKDYYPELRRHDLKFIPPPAMVEHLYTALAHYHFHAQEYKNRSYAGPGLGDMKLADRLGPNCLVFTFIDQDRLNADYYQPGGVVIDLGTIHRP